MDHMSSQGGAGQQLMFVASAMHVFSNVIVSLSHQYTHAEEVNIPKDFTNILAARYIPLYSIHL